MIMKYITYLACNSSEIRDRLRDNGYKLCPCCEYDGANWLTIDTNNKNVHGSGYGCEHECEGMNVDKCIKCEIYDCIKHKVNVMIFSNVDDLLEIQ